MSMMLTLSDRSSKIVQSRIDNNGYVDAQDVIDAALSETEDFEDEILIWLSSVVGTTYEDWKANPDKIYTSAEVKERLSVFMSKESAKSA